MCWQDHLRYFDGVSQFAMTFKASGIGTFRPPSIQLSFVFFTLKPRHMFRFSNYVSSHLLILEVGALMFETTSLMVLHGLCNFTWPYICG
jgi:hypothetical protein